VRVVPAVVAIGLVVSGGAALSGRTEAAPAPPAELSMRVSAEGMTYDQYRQRQAEMVTRLLGDLPARALDAPTRVELTREEVRSVEQGPRLQGTPLAVGLVKGLAPRLDVNGLLKVRRGFGGPSRDGGYDWAIALTSSGAGAIRAHIEGMELPPGAELSIYSRMGEAFGPYRFNGPNGDGEFWTDTVFGTEAILQVHVAAPATADDLAAVAFSVTEAGIILPRYAGEYTPLPAPPLTFPCGNPTCLVDATCGTTGAPAVPAKNAVAKMEWSQGNFFYTCTGTLLNDTNPSQDNFFLTAAHCIGNNKSAGNVQFYWRFATSSCNGTCPDNAGWPFKTSGSTVAATGKKGDYTLLHLNAPPPSGSVFLGWNSTPIANTSGAHLYRISNPDFGPQVYSQHDVDTAFGACGGWPRGNWVYSRDIVGAIDGGSSGSSILNDASQVVGQLSGTCGGNVSSACDSGPGEANTTVDGAFASYFAAIKPIINP
jgi:V8-like Glu-specific endopeptidase